MKHSFLASRLSTDEAFFPGPDASLKDPLTALAAAEAVIGLIIEISFIATFTQRFFGK